VSLYGEGAIQYEYMNTGMVLVDSVMQTNFVVLYDEIIELYSSIDIDLLFTTSGIQRARYPSFGYSSPRTCVCP
jgi:hypothetical protein